MLDGSNTGLPASSPHESEEAITDRCDADIALGNRTRYSTRSARYGPNGSGASPSGSEVAGEAVVTFRAMDRRGFLLVLAANRAKVSQEKA